MTFTTLLRAAALMLRNLGRFNLDNRFDDTYRPVYISTLGLPRLRV